jgi:hypothetical protein
MKASLTRSLRPPLVRRGGIRLRTRR